MRRVVAIAAFTVLLQTPARARAADDVDVNALAKDTQNPVGDVVSMPFQFNFNTGGDLADADYFLLNFQPVVPIRITPSWNVIARTIVPFPSIPNGSTTEGGIGDIQEQLYFTPTRPGAIIWGVGPMLSLPTATNPLARTGSWAAGPGAVVLTMPGPWVLGGLVNMFYTFKDEGGDPKVNLVVIQPFINWNFGTGWALSSSPILTHNAELPDGDQWTVPVGAGISRTLVFKAQPMSLSAAYFTNVVRPPGAALNQLRFQLSLIHPTAKK